MAITDNPQTYCIGRLLVDLPQSLSLTNPDRPVVIENIVHLGSGMNITTQTGVSLKAFQQQVDARWAEVQTYTHEATGSRRPYAQLPELHVVRDNGVVMAFYHTMIRGRAGWEDGKRVFEEDVMLHDAEGYYWDNGTMFIIKDGSHRNATNNIVRVMSNMRYMALGEIPNEPGICMNGGFIAHHFASQAESILWSAALPYSLRIVINSGTGVRSQTMLERERAKEGMLADFLAQETDKIYGIHTYRSARRPADHFASEELVSGTAEGYKDNEPPGFQLDFGGEWEFSGKLHPDPLPYIRMDLGFATHLNERPDVLGAYPQPMADSAYPSEAEFFAVWDMVGASIRLFPGALTPQPQPPDNTRPGPGPEQISSDKQTLDDFLDENPHAGK